MQNIENVVQKWDSTKILPIGSVGPSSTYKLRNFRGGAGSIFMIGYLIELLYLLSLNKSLSCFPLHVCGSCNPNTFETYDVFLDNKPFESMLVLFIGRLERRRRYTDLNDLISLNFHAKSFEERIASLLCQGFCWKDKNSHHKLFFDENVNLYYCHIKYQIPVISLLGLI